MRCFFAGICLLLLCLPAQARAQEFITLCYHDVEDRVTGTADAISSERLVQHFSWLRANGFHVIGVDDLLAAQRRERMLPSKPVLLTFDDGYASFYTRVYPLLKAFRYPAVLAVVGGWVDAAPGDRVVASRPGRKLLDWEQLRELAASGLVEIASHSHDLHRGIPANPQDNQEPALIARRYDAGSSSYEGDAAHLARVRADLSRNSDLIQQKLGLRPRVMVWPFGRYHEPAIGIARELGMPITLTLDSGPGHTDSLDRVSRYLVPGDQKLDDLVWEIYHPDREDPRRVAHVDLDYVYDPDPARQEKNLDRLLDRIKNLGINTVFLQAFADPDGNGTADQLYFPNRHLPVRADLFNRVSWQLKTRAGVQVYAWMPMLGFDLGDASMTVQSAAAPEDGYRRLSPFVPAARRTIGEIYEDLARYADFDGLLFHDDGYLSDFEDVNPAALTWFRERLQAAAAPEEIRKDAALSARWTRSKSHALLEWTGELAEKVKIWRPSIKTARNIYAEPVLDPASEAWYAQNLRHFLDFYDYTAVMAMPYMEQADDPEGWLYGLVDAVKKYPDGLGKTIFELQTLDWEAGTRIPNRVLANQMRVLQRLGAANYGYYPDDFIRDHPASVDLQRVISMKKYPDRQPP